MRGLDTATGRQTDVEHRLAVVVGERRDGLELTALVDRPQTQLAHIGHPRRAARLHPRSDEELADRLQTDVGPHVGVRRQALPAALRSVDLHHPAARQPADAERDVERDGAGRNDPDGHPHLVAQAHDRALAEALVDLRERHLEGLLAVRSCHVVLLWSTSSTLALRSDRR